MNNFYCISACKNAEKYAISTSIFWKFSGGIQSFLHLNKVLFNFCGDCPCCSDGTINLWKDSSAADGQIWHCANHRCRYKVTVCKHSFFAGSHLSFATMCKIIYCWAHKYPQQIVIHELHISHTTVVDFFNSYQKVSSVVLERYSEPMGGPGKIAEIDESKFGKRNYNRGKHVDGCWVFGGIERDSNPQGVFLLQLLTVPHKLLFR